MMTPVYSRNAALGSSLSSSCAAPLSPPRGFRISWPSRRTRFRAFAVWVSSRSSRVIWLRRSSGTSSARIFGAPRVAATGGGVRSQTTPASSVRAPRRSRRSRQTVRSPTTPASVRTPSPGGAATGVRVQSTTRVRPVSSTIGRARSVSGSAVSSTRPIASCSSPAATSAESGAPRAVSMLVSSSASAAGFIRSIVDPRSSTSTAVVRWSISPEAGEGSSGSWADRGIESDRLRRRPAAGRCRPATGLSGVSGRPSRQRL